MKGQYICQIIPCTSGIAVITLSEDNAAVLTAVRSPHKVAGSIEICFKGKTKFRAAP